MSKGYLFAKQARKHSKSTTKQRRFLIRHNLMPNIHMNQYSIYSINQSIEIINVSGQIIKSQSSLELLTHDLKLI